jgi:nucleoside diphosphate kinase
MRILEQLQEIVLERSKGYSDEQFHIRGQWGIDLLFRPNVHERTFHYQVIVTQTVRQGCCYCYCESPVIDADLMGVDARYAIPDNRCLRIALLDAAFSAFHDNSLKDFVLDGTSAEKATIRADIVSSEVLMHIPDSPKGSKPSVVNVGVVGNIIRQLKQRGLDVYATDLDPGLIGQLCHGTVVQDGREHTLELVERCDVALITGMTLSSGSLEAIIRTAKKAGTKVVMFAETGAWFAQEYCDSFGIDAVIGEPFPFYIFEGRSIIRLHRPTEQ